MWVSMGFHGSHKPTHTHTHSIGYTPEPTKLNTSAAECGNAGLSRIAKTVSYMSQRHAVIYTGIFLELWSHDCAVHLEQIATELGIDSAKAFVNHILFHEMFGHDHIDAT